MKMHTVFQSLFAFSSLLAASLAASGCATVHPGTEASAMQANPRIPLHVSAETSEEQAGKGYVLVNLTFENTGDRWVKIAESEVKISPQYASKVSVVVGKDLEDWSAAIKATSDLERQRRGILQGTLLAAGAVLALSTSSRSGTGMAAANDLGVATVIGTSAYAAFQGLNENKRKHETPQWIPDTHLYQPFSLPAKLFVRKWVLLNKPASEIVNKLVFEVKTVEGESETYEVTL
jgi:hypothetical protein